MNSHAKRQRAQAALAVVGVDAGKFEHMLVVRPRQQDDSPPFRFKTTRTGYDAAAAYILQATRAAHPQAAPRDILVGIEFAGSYGFTLAHYLHLQGFQVVNVLASDTKAWKGVTHHKPLKTDAKDAIGITDLTATGHFVSFAFLGADYAELRYLVSTRERFGMQRRAAITRLKSTLELVFPEFEHVFEGKIHTPSALAVLEAFPGPARLLAARPADIRKALTVASRNHKVAEHFDGLMTAAKATLGLPAAQGAPARELPLLVAQLRLLEQQLKVVEREMRDVLDRLPETEFLLSIPGVKHVSAGTFLGSVGDPRAYESSAQILSLAGLTLVENSSGTRKGKERISKRGRPVLRRHAYIFALRCVRKNGLLRADFERMIANNGGIKVKALAALSRKVLKIMYAVARDRRPFVRVHVPAGAKRTVTGTVTPAAIAGVAGATTPAARQPRKAVAMTSARKAASSPVAPAKGASPKRRTK